MLTYTDEGKAAVHEALAQAGATGHYGDKFRASLHTQLSQLHMRSEHITLSWGKCKIEPDKEAVKFIFEAEFALHWINEETGNAFMHGGLIWHESDERFSTHT